jgi:hypothetical protein
MWTVQYGSSFMYFLYRKWPLAQNVFPYEFQREAQQFGFMYVNIYTKYLKKKLANAAVIYILFEYYRFSFRFHSVANSCKNVLRALQFSTLCLLG